MAITGLKTWTDGDSATAANLNTDRLVLESKFNAGITSVDLAASAGITNGQLANNQFEIVLRMQITATGLVVAAASMITEVASYVAIPSDSSSASTDIYTVTGCEIITQMAGTRTTNCIVSLVYGDGTTWSNIMTGITISKITGLAAANVNPTAGDAMSISVPASASTQKFFALKVSQQGVGYTGTDTAILVFKLRRANGLK